MLGTVKQKWNYALPFVFVALFALSRWPGLLPWNFSLLGSLFMRIQKQIHQQRINALRVHHDLLGLRSSRSSKQAANRSNVGLPVRSTPKG